MKVEFCQPFFDCGLLDRMDNITVNNIPILQVEKRLAKFNFYTLMENCQFLKVADETHSTLCTAYNFITAYNIIGKCGCPLSITQ